MAAFRTCLLLVSVKLVSRACLHTVTQRASLPALSASPSTHLALLATSGQMQPLYYVHPSRDHLLARMSHVGLPQLQGSLGNVGNIGGEDQTQLILSVLEKRDLPFSTLNMAREWCLDISRVMKGVRTLSLFEKQTSKDVIALNCP